MARKKNDLSLFDKALRESGYNPEEGKTIQNVDTILDTDTGIDDVDKDDEPTVPENNTVEDVNKNEDVHEDNTEIPEDVLNKINDNSSENESDDEEEVEEQEGEETVDDNSQPYATVGDFFDAFAEANNWQVSDEDKPKTVEDLVDYIKDLVEENSKPEYADPRVEQLNEYVRNGGNFDDFYNGMSEQISYDSIDIEDESNQKMAVREYLKYQGYSDEQINSKIERYEDAAMLQDEASDAVERLKQIKQNQIQEQERAQKEEYERNQQQLQQFVTDLNTSVSNLTNIRGISVPKEDRQRLMEYITRVDENGLTQYQKDFGANQVQNLIESAYFTMKGDALLNGAKAAGKTTAVNKLRGMLKHSSKNHSSYNTNDDKEPSLIDIASRYYK